MSSKKNLTWTIARREWAAYWTSPAAYIVTALFLIFSGILFFSTFFLNGRAELRNFFTLLPILLALFTPALTMRLFSEELKSGSFETLMTLPVKTYQVVLGKFLAAFFTDAAMLFPTLFYVITARVFGKPDFGPIIGGYIGALFLCAAFCAIGIFSSACTKNQIIAFFTALALSVALTMISSLLVFIPSGAVKFLSWISVSTHFSSIARGIVDSRDILYFVSLTLLFILLTVRRFVLNWKKSDSADFALFIAILALLNLTGAKAFFRADLTEDKIYSISRASKETVRNLTEPLSVNVFFSSNLPSPYNNVEQYLRDILAEYKAAANENFSYKFFDMDKKESTETAHSYGLRQTQVQKVETTEVSAKAVWMSAAIVYGDEIKTFDDMDSSQGLEYKITTSITKMISSADTLASLKSGMTLTLYPAAEIKKQISGLDRLEQRISGAAAELNKKYSGRINFRVMNASGEEAEALGDKYGIQPINFSAEKNGEESTTALGLVLELGEDFRTIPLQLANLGFLGWHLVGAENIQDSIESSIESLLSKTVEIGYVTGHGENSLNGNPYSNGQEPTSENLRAVLNDIYTLREINLKEEDIPLNINCLMINGPKEKFSDAELFKIDQFVMKGGNLLLTPDPLVESTENGPNAPPSYTKPDTGLDSLLETWGIKAGANYVMDEKCYEARQQGNPGGTKLNWAPLLFREQVNRKNPITKYITGMIFLQSGAIDISGAQNDSDLTATVLARSSDKSWTVSENIILYPGYIFPPEEKEKIHENNLSVLVEGKFKSAFAGKEAPLLENREQEADGLQGAAGDSLKAREKLERGIQKAKIVLINSSVVTTGQLVDAAGNEPMAYFLRNAVDFLNGAEDYCEMRTKGTARSLLDIKSSTAATVFKFLNQFALAALVALTGLLVWRLRTVRRNEIRIKYNSGDEREITHLKAADAKGDEK